MVEVAIKARSGVRANDNAKACGKSWIPLRCIQATASAHHPRLARSDRPDRSVDPMQAKPFSRLPPARGRP
jgi:hypothetical protein